MCFSVPDSWLIFFLFALQVATWIVPHALLRGQVQGLVCSAGVCVAQVFVQRRCLCSTRLPWSLHSICLRQHSCFKTFPLFRFWAMGRRGFPWRRAPTNLLRHLATHLSLASLRARSVSRGLGEAHAAERRILTLRRLYPNLYQHRVSPNPLTPPRSALTLQSPNRTNQTVSNFSQYSKVLCVFKTS